MFCKKGVLRIFAKFTAKHLKQSLFLRKLQALACSSKKKALAQVLSCEFCDISKNAFPTEHLQATASEVLFQTYESISRCSQLIYLCKKFPNWRWLNNENTKTMRKIWSNFKIKLWRDGDRSGVFVFFKNMICYCYHVFIDTLSKYRLYLFYLYTSISLAAFGKKFDWLQSISNQLLLGIMF